MTNTLAQAVNSLNVQFINKIKGSEEERYSAILMVNSVGTKTLYANEGYTEIGLVPKTGQLFVTAIYLKNSGGFDIGQGSAYFTFNAATAEVEVTMISLPRGTVLEAKGDNKFDLTISELR